VGCGAPQATQSATTVLFGKVFDIGTRATPRARPSQLGAASSGQSDGRSWPRGLCESAALAAECIVRDLDLIENGVLRHVAGSMLSWKRVMFSERRGSGRRLAGALALALLVPSLTACAPVVGGGVLVAVVAIGALTSHCYDYIDVSVYDPLGRRTCAATVTATSGGDQFELKSCYYAPLTDGHWSIRASLPGLPDAVSTVDVEHENDCTRHVQSMELTLNTPGTRPALPLPLPPSPDDRRALPPPPAAPPALPPPSASPPAVSASSALPAPAAAPAAPPAGSSPPPSVGVFPDQTPHPSPAK